MLIKEAVYELCEHCQRPTGVTLQEAVFGCDWCKKETESYMTLQVFFDTSDLEVTRYNLCSWICLWRKLEALQKSGEKFGFIELPTIDSTKDLDEFLLMP